MGNRLPLGLTIGFTIDSRYLASNHGSKDRVEDMAAGRKREAGRKMSSSGRSREGFFAELP